MKTYSVLFAEDVPHYATAEIKAASDADVLAAAADADFDELFLEPAWENACCRRIVHIADESGKILAADVALDNWFVRYGGEPDRRLCDAAPELLAALKSVSAAVLALATERDPDQPGLWDAALAPARTAIAKAEAQLCDDP